MRVRSLAAVIAASLCLSGDAKEGAGAQPPFTGRRSLLASATGDESPLTGTSIERPTTEGPVRGYWHKGTWHFRGIPYARPPVGERRWRAPLPPASRGGAVFDAGAWGPACPQAGQGSPFSTVTQAEDCLNLNVWTRAVVGAKAVMVWIHGGGFAIGSAVTPGAMGDTLAREHGVVVVSLNYRLGALGFLVHEELIGDDPDRVETAGNYGLLDQLRALEWVRENIASFGGDPGNVTVFGESAGGISVLGLIASALGEGLFHRAIVQSGPPWGDLEIFDLAAASGVGRGFAARLGCADLACMRAKSADAVVAAHGAGAFALLEAPDRAMVPVRDGHVFQDSILDRFRAGRPKPAVGLLVGSNSLEGTVPQASLWAFGVRDWPSWARERFGPAAGGTIEDLYFSGQYGLSGQAAGEMLADGVFTCPTRRLVGLAGEEGAPVYVYWFDYPTSLFPGALHGSEIPFVFRNVDGFPGSREDRASRSLATYWTNFARTGDPNGGTEARWDPWPAGYLEVEKRFIPAQGRPGTEYMTWSDVGGWRDDSPLPLMTKDALCDAWDSRIEPLAGLGDVEPGASCALLAPCGRGGSALPVLTTLR